MAGRVNARTIAGPEAFVGFAANAVTLAYTPRSRGAAHVNADNGSREALVICLVISATRTLSLTYRLAMVDA